MPAAHKLELFLANADVGDIILYVRKLTDAVRLDQDQNKDVLIRICEREAEAYAARSRMNQYYNKSKVDSLMATLITACGVLQNSGLMLAIVEKTNKRYLGPGVQFCVH